MRVFRGKDAIRKFLTAFDEWLSKSVSVYLLGGSAMTARGLKDQTQDVDLALAATAEFEHVYEILRERGFEVTSEPTEPFDDVGTTVELQHSERGLQLDLFERQILGKVWITDRMHDRADEFWTGKQATAYVLSDEDMFLLKTVAGGDLGSGRRRDLEDMRIFAQRGLDYDAIIYEIEQQRPFNTGATEVEHIRNRSHPLFAIETAVEHLEGLPASFTERISEFATEFEVEYVVLTAVEDSIRDREAVEDHVQATVRTLSDNVSDHTETAIERLIEKRILVRKADGTIRLTAPGEHDY